MRERNRSKERVTHERLLSLLNYDPETGLFTQKVSRGGKFAGSPAGTLDPIGYLKLYIDGRNYWAHRVAWFYVNGEWPSKHVDHRNLNRADNRIANLRQATNGENMTNVGVRKHSTTGVTGVYWHWGCGKWCAQIVKDGVHYYLGVYSEKQSAIAARRAAELKIHGEFAPR